MNRRDYTREISMCWLPHTGRKKLKTYERQLIKEWFERGIEVGPIARAILRCKARLKAQGKPLLSLGIVRGDLEAVLRGKASVETGSSHSPLATTHWRHQWAEALAALAQETADPERAAMYNELRAALAGLTKEEAERRWREIGPQ